MAVKRRLMIPLTQSHFCCCSPTLSLHSAEVVMKRFTRHRAAEDAVLVGRAFCCCCYCFITIVQKPFSLNFLLNMGFIFTVCMRERSVLCLPLSQFSCSSRCSVLVAWNQSISSLCCVCSPTSLSAQWCLRPETSLCLLRFHLIWDHT